MFSGASMKNIIRWAQIAILTLATTFLLPVSGQAQDLPAGPGRDRMLTACTACHGLENITNPHKKLTAEEWETYFYDMVARGAAVEKDEMEDVKQYLIKNFAVKQN